MLFSGLDAALAVPVQCSEAHFPSGPDGPTAFPFHALTSSGSNADADAWRQLVQPTAVERQLETFCHIVVSVRKECGATWLQ